MVTAHALPRRPRPRASFAAWAAWTLLGAHPVSAQPAGPSVSGLDSMITTQGAPHHLMLDARNPLSRPVLLRIVSVEHVLSREAAVTLGAVELHVGARVAPGAAPLGSGFHDTVTVYFDPAGLNPNRSRYRFRVRVALGGRPRVLFVNVTRGVRHPWRH